MAQIRPENMPEKAQAFGFPKVIELSLYDRHFLKKVKISPLGHLNNAHHGMIIVHKTLYGDNSKGSFDKIDLLEFLEA